MILASDLDRTLIYSKRFINEKINIKSELVLIEKKEDIEISYITKTSIELLKKIIENIIFIPATTRTVEQYQRISLAKENIIPKYAIVSNGGNILENGKLNEEWNDTIKNQLNKNSTNYEDVKRKFSEISNKNWLLRSYTADNLFLYYIVDQEKIPMDKIYDFEIWLKENRWTLSMQGRKLYLIPDCVDKWKAINFICEKENDYEVIAAGDSLLDLKMLNKSKYAISPSHGEIKSRVFRGKKEQNSIVFTKRSGFYAADDIMLEIIDYIKKV
ncbi:MAG: HAD family hydrolase [Clostridiales bacterium]